MGGAGVGLDVGGEPVALDGGEKAGGGRAVGKEDEDGEAQQDGGDAFDQEEPLPAVEVVGGDLQEDAGQWRADDAGERGGGEEPGGGAVRAAGRGSNR